MKTINHPAMASPLVRLVRAVRHWLPAGRNPSARLPESDRLLALQRFVAQEFQGRWLDMTARDRRTYQRLIHCQSLQTARWLRFDCYDLMCRLLGEGVARTRLQHVDALLQSRR